MLIDKVKVVDLVPGDEVMIGVGGHLYRVREKWSYGADDYNVALKLDNIPGHLVLTKHDTITARVPASHR